MNFLERIETILHHRKPDKIPFCPYGEKMGRGDLERTLRNRGMGLLIRHFLFWSEVKDISVEYKTEGSDTITLYHTPEGTVSARHRTHLNRLTDRDVQLEWPIKEPKDYDAVIFMINNTIFHPDYVVFKYKVRRIGTDGIVRGDGFAPPYDRAERWYFGLEKWVFEQRDHPSHVAALLEAMDIQAERLFPLITDSPAKFVHLGPVRPHKYGPKDFKKYMMPFYKKYVPSLKKRGKICSVHADDSRLQPFKKLIAETGAQIVEAYTPTPISDLSIEEARAAWGPDAIIWVNFPETVYWEGKEQTKEYTLSLLRSDPHPGRLLIGMTEMGTAGIVDQESEKIYKEGMIAIMDAIDEFSDNYV